jgi:hypothetical protein
MDAGLSTTMFASSSSISTINFFKKIQKGNCRQNLRKDSFKNRVTDIWNDLPQELIQAKTVKSFEILLDKYWENQEVEFDYD